MCILLVYTLWIYIYHFRFQQLFVMSDLTEKTSKAWFFLEGHRGKTIKQVRLTDATPSKLLLIFKRYGLEEKPEFLEVVENGMHHFSPHCNAVFENLEANGTYQIQFSGHLKGISNCMRASSLEEIKFAISFKTLKQHDPFLMIATLCVSGSVC